jgi:hypothetical protein
VRYVEHRIALGQTSALDAALLHALRWARCACRALTSPSRRIASQEGEERQGPMVEEALLRVLVPAKPNSDAGPAIRVVFYPPPSPEEESESLPLACGDLPHAARVPVYDTCREEAWLKRQGSSGSAHCDSPDASAAAGDSCNPGQGIPRSPGRSEGAGVIPSSSDTGTMSVHHAGLFLWRDSRACLLSRGSMDSEPAPEEQDGSNGAAAEDRGGGGLVVSSALVFLMSSVQAGGFFDRRAFGVKAAHDRSHAASVLFSR